MIYIIAREIGGGYAEYVADIPHMLLTMDPDLAQQLGDEDLEKMDMPYMNREGFFAVEISRMGIMIRPEQRFRPPMPHFRPRIVHRKAGPLQVRPPRPLVPTPPERRGPGPENSHPRRPDRPPQGRPHREARPGQEMERRTGGRNPAHSRGRGPGGHGGSNRDL